jgi:Na+:H+ antiporter, NhaA family
MGRGLPLALRAFLLTLAVVDDLGAITVIAVFYSDKFNPAYFLGAVVCVVIWWVLQHRRVGGVRVGLLVYLPLAMVTWYLTHESGVHATVAGVALGLATRVGTDPGEAESPGDRVEYALRPFVAGFAVPLFAFASAGVSLSGGDAGLGEMLTSPVTLVAVGFLAGIGFTVSLLIAELAFFEEKTLLAEAKLGILSATLGAAVLSALVLARRRRALAELIAAEEADVDADGIPDVYETGPQPTQPPPTAR